MYEETLIRFALETGNLVNLICKMEARTTDSITIKAVVSICTHNLFYVINPMGI